MKLPEKRCRGIEKRLKKQKDTLRHVHAGKAHDVIIKSIKEIREKYPELFT